MGRKLMVGELLPWSGEPDVYVRLEATRICERMVVRILADNQAAVTLSLSDDDFAKLVGGQTQAQRLFMAGKLKIKGDVMKVGYRSLPLLKTPPLTIA